MAGVRYRNENVSSIITKYYSRVKQISVGYVRQIRECVDIITMTTKIIDPWHLFKPIELSQNRKFDN